MNINFPTLQNLFHSSYYPASYERNVRVAYLVASMFTMYVLLNSHHPLVHKLLSDRLLSSDFGGSKLDFRLKSNILQGNNCILWIDMMPSLQKLGIFLENKILTPQSRNSITWLTLIDTFLLNPWEAHASSMHIA